MSWFSRWLKSILDMLNQKSEEPSYKITLLSPKRHTRRLTCYYIPATLEPGDFPVNDIDGNVIAMVGRKSREQLAMEGTGKLPDGRLINVVSTAGKVVWVDGSLCYEVLDKGFPYGKGIYDEPLVPFYSLAANLSQIKEHLLFNRKVIIPHLISFFRDQLGRGTTGEFRVHDTGGAMKACPFEKGLWRNGGQFDVFVRDWETYKLIRSVWKDYAEVIIMPRDVSSPKGIQETLNLLLDSGLNIDGIVGPLTTGAIRELQKRTGIEENGKWDTTTQQVAARSLNNWR